MAKTQIKYKTQLSSLTKGGKPCYIAQVVHTGTVTAADICEACKQENPQMTEPLAPAVSCSARARRPRPVCF